MIQRRTILSLLAGTWSLACMGAANAQEPPYDLGPEQRGRVRADKDAAAVALLPKSFAFATTGALTVGISPGGPPLATYATDAETVVGADPDIAQLLADALGLKLNLVPVAWADWPLGLSSGKYDAIISNVGVTEQRKEKFDFSTYRLGLHGFFVKADSKVGSIKEPKDAAGLSISVGGGTNQERILVEWSKQNVAAGLKPLELQLFDDDAARLIALRSGRADVIVQPHAQLVFVAARDKDIKQVGTLSAGWPLRSDVAVATRKGSGLAEALTLANNQLIANGKYGQALAHWSLEEEALDRSETNPPGLPKYRAMADVAIQNIAFLTRGSYDDANPRAGLDETLSLFEEGEKLGFESAWVRQRHLEPGISSATTFLAAATQRTRKIGLGTAVIQMGYENPFRLAEDLSLVDVLSGGRLNVGLSAGPPAFGALLGERFFDGDPATADYSHNRIARLAANLKGDWLGDVNTRITSAAGSLRPRLRPHAPGLDQRLWYGGGSLRSARWAGENGFNLLVGNLNSGEDTDSFFEAQRRHIEIFRRHCCGLGEPRIAVGRVIVPLDSADHLTRDRYRAYAASRHTRTLAPQGERRTLFAPDLVGPAAALVEQLAADPILQLADTLRLELPYNFAAADYRQILSDFAQLVAPKLGWQVAAHPADTITLAAQTSI